MQKVSILFFCFYFFVFLETSLVHAQCVVNADLNTWQQKGNPANGTWVVNAAGTFVSQTTNGQSTYFVSPFDLINVEVTGEFRSTDADDDWIGFVFGFRDPLGTNYDDFDMLLFDWEQQVQGCAPRGMSLARVLGDIPNPQPNAFGCHVPSAEFNILADDFGGPGWVRNQWHQFRLIYTFTRIIIYVDGVLRFDVNGCFLPGRFGFYNRSQRDTQYRNFSYRLNIDFDYTSSTFCPNSDIQFNFLPNCINTNNFDFTTIQFMNWDFGDGNQLNTTNVNVSNINPIHRYSAPGTYQVSLTLTDALGCSSTETKQVVINQNPVAGFTIPNGCINNLVVVNNTSASGVSITDAVWDIGNGNIVNGISPNGFTYNNPGNYTVSLTITDANGCSASATRNTEIITQIDATLNAVDSNCPNVNDGTVAIVSINNGTSPYAYLWSNGETSQNVQNLEPSVYSVVTTDVNGCTGNYTATVGINNTIPLQYSFDISDYNGYNVSCKGSNDGIVTVNVLNGAFPFNYLWQNNIQSNVAEYLSAGSYSVTISDANTCTVSATVVLTEPDALSATINVISNYNGEAVTCFGATDGSLNIIPIGGVGSYSYLWSNNENSPVVDNLAAGNYSVTVVDINGCSATSSINISQPDLLQAMLLANEFSGTYNISCNGNSDGRINSNIIGGTMPYSYNWNNGAFTESIQNLFAGSYSLTVVDINGCEAIQNVVLTEPNTLTVELQTEDLVCYGDNNGFINSVVSGGSGNYGFLWSNNATETSVSNLTAGDYSVTVTDANNCSTTASVLLNQPNPVIVTIQSVSDTIPFYGANLQLLSTYFANGNEAIQFEWTPEGSLNNASIQSPVANPLFTTTYTLKVTDSDGCIGTDSIRVYVNNDKVLYIPNAFSPNGDGENDIFKIYTYNNAIRNLTFQVHNRWGELLFQTNNMNEGWDGTKNGKVLDTGVYIYTVYVIFLDGNSNKKKGSVTLLK